MRNSARPAGIEARVHVLQVAQGADEEPRAHEQDEGERDLHHHERAGAQGARAASDRARAALELGREVDAARAQRRAQAEQDRGAHGHRDVKASTRASIGCSSTTSERLNCRSATSRPRPQKASAVPEHRGQRRTGPGSRRGAGARCAPGSRPGRGGPRSPAGARRRGRRGASPRSRRRRGARGRRAPSARPAIDGSGGGCRSRPGRPGRRPASALPASARCPRRRRATGPRASLRAPCPAGSARGRRGPARASAPGASRPITRIHQYQGCGAAGGRGRAGSARAGPAAP